MSKRYEKIALAQHSLHMDVIIKDISIETQAGYKALQTFGAYLLSGHFLSGIWIQLDKQHFKHHQHYKFN